MKAGVLIRTEWIKARHRVAARVPVLLFVVFISLIFGGSFYVALKEGATPPSLPGAWSNIISGPQSLSLFFVAVVLMLLISSEFTWRTARQNVIDGLSREEWFTAKLLLLPASALLFLVAQVGIGGAFALVGTWMGETSGPLITAVDLASLGGFALALLGMGSLAFMLAFLTRNSGSAISLFFLYSTIGEALLGLILGRYELLKPVVRHLPATTFFKLMERSTFDPAVVERIAAAAAGAGRTPPPVPNTPLIITLAITYSVLFIGIAFVVYRRRDL